MAPPLRIVYFGTPEFAVAPLELLVKQGYDIVGVVTAPDKPAGRGQQVQQSAVKQYALAHGLKILQPAKLKDEKFLEELHALQADLQIIVAFRMLPKAVWAMPRQGTFNLHASLLPKFRGAAPINRAIMCGEKETGVTTFFLEQEIDTGKIIFQEKIAIGENETAGELHDRLMQAGAQLVLKTVKAIELGEYPQVDQQALLIPGDSPPMAPKLFKENCRTDWSTTTSQLFNHIRGLSPHPAAWTTLHIPGKEDILVKLFTVRKGNEKVVTPYPGKILTDHRTFIRVDTADGWIYLTELQLAGKKRMKTEEFLRGFTLPDDARFV